MIHVFKLKVNTSFQLVYCWCIIVAMNKKHGGPRQGSGRKKINGGIKRRNVGLTESQINHLVKKYGGISEGLRILADADMDQTSK